MRQVLRSSVLFCTLWMLIPSSQAQFAFTYTGPDTIFVDESCTGILEWGHPETPQAFPTMPGQVVISFTIFSISGGYMMGDSVPAGEIVTVFYEARDNMGHIVLFGFNISFVDTLPPIFDPQTIPGDVTISCGDDISPASILFSDNCDSDTAMTVLTFDESGAVDVCAGGSITRTWTLTDPSGNTAEHIQQITVEPDTVAPDITGVPVDGNAACGDAMDAYTAWLDAQRQTFMADDAGCGIMEIFDNAPSPSVLLGFCGEIAVDFFATDSCDNTSSVCASFFVTNEVAPIILTPASDAMGDCSGGNPSGEFNTWISTRGGADASDDCSIVMWSTDPPDPSLSDTCNGAIIVTFIADDGCGNTASTTAEFFVSDTVPPTVQSEATNRIVNCSSVDVEQELGMWINSRGNSQASDICTEEDALLISYMIEGQAVDSAGIMAAFQDSILTGCVDGVIIDGIIWNDVLALIEVDFIYSDVCGNSTSTSGLFGITDAVGPEFTAPPQDQLVTCTSNDLPTIFALWYQSAGFALGEDDCGSVFYRGSPDETTAYEMLESSLDTACGSGASVSVAFYINDFCGNENPDSMVGTFSIIDSIGPVLEVAPMDVQFSCNGSAQDALEAWLDTLGGAQATDLCGNIAWSFHWQQGSDSLSGIPGSGPYPDLGSLSCDDGLPVIFVATDICANSASDTAAFVFVDTVAPVITIEEPVVVVPCDSTPDAGNILVTDDCTTDPIITFSDSTLTTGDTTGCNQFSGMILRTWIAQDECGNVATETQLLQISDDQPPTFVPPADTIFGCTGNFDPSVTGQPTMVSDNCDDDPFVTYVDDMSGSGCDFLISRLWIVTDACENADSAVQMIQLLDTVPPDLQTAPSDLIVACASNLNVQDQFDNWVNSGAGIQTTDGCGAATYFMATPGSYTLNDTTTYPGTAPALPQLQDCEGMGDSVLAEVFADVVYYDACGNAGVMSVHFAVTDDDPPEIIQCLPSVTEEIDTSTCMATFSVQPPLAVEQCLSQSENVLQEITVPLTSSVPGDSMTPVQSMLFSFMEVPVFPDVAFNPELTVRLDGVDADGSGEFFFVQGEGDVTLGQTSNVPAECDSGTTAIPLTSGQMAEWGSDGLADFILVPNVPQGDGAGAVNDICPGASVTLTLSYTRVTSQEILYAYKVNDSARIALDSFTAFSVDVPAGVHQLTHYVTDCAGNEDSCVTELIAFDGTPPEMTCPQDITASAEGAECQAIVTLRVPLVSENCGLDGPVRYRATGATVIDEMPFPANADSVLEVFAAGTSIVTYLATDLSGNVDSCSFEVSVQDPTPPEASCQDALVFVHPAGNIPLILQPEIIDAGSVDNCEITDMTVTPSIFPCDSAGTEQTVQLVVEDASGNSDSCSSIVRIEVAPLEPSFSVGICESDTLRLFANVPDAPGNPYTFSWSGPNDYVSNLENPILPGAGASASGTYVLVVTGIGGCTSMGSIAVVIEDINAPDISAEASTVCAEDPVILQASGFSQPVTYSWYRGTPPDGLLLGTSANPTFIDIPPVPGDYSYYVIVESENCVSNPSQTVFVSVVTAPEATVNDLFIELCAGETITLGTPVSDPDITYEWTGPNGFTSNEQFPPAITNAQEVHEGVYSLLIFLGDCMSNEASTVVIVDPRPDKPVIMGDSVYCEGGNMTLVVNNVEDADQYVWMHPNGSSIPTFSNALTLNGIGEEVMGQWTVTAMLDDCASESSDPFTVNVEESLVITTSNTGPVCAGDSVTLLVQIIPGAEYMWSGPAGFTSSEPNPTLLGVAGNYTLETMSASGCEATSTTTVVVDEAPMITALSNSGGNCADGTGDLTFAATVFPPDDGTYTYNWSGPGFASTDSAPVIENFTSANNGVYALVVFQGNCPSDTVFTTVEVTDSPAQPVIEGAVSWCTGQDLILTTQSFGGDSVLYTWTTPLGTVEVLNSNELELQNVQTNANGQYSVMVYVDGCPSVPSDPVTIEVLPPLDQPEVLAPTTVCMGDSLILIATDAPGATYQWSGPDDFSSDLASPVIFPASAVNAGTYQVAVTVGPCTSPLSDPFFVEVLDRPASPQLEPFSSTICLDDPGLVTLCIDAASATSGAQYTWTNQTNGSVLSSGSGALCLDLTDVSQFGAGLNEITVEATLQGCVSGLSDPLVVEAVTAPGIQAEAGPDRIYCLSDLVQLEATAPPAGTGSWTAASGAIAFDDPSDAQTMVTGLVEGENILYWSLSFASCNNYSVDTVIIFVEPTPVLAGDTVLVPFGMTVDFNVLINDLIPDQIMLGIVEPPGKGNVLDDGDGRLIYSPNIGYVGEDMIRYEVCSAECPAQCDEALVIIQVGNENDCFVPTIFTPNQDGVNDLLIVPCLETDSFPDSRIAIFNVWGDTVFEANPYRNDWDGTRDGKDVPVGTYYYVVDFGDDSPLRKGFLIIER